MCVSRSCGANLALADPRLLILIPYGAVRYGTIPYRTVRSQISFALTRLVSLRTICFMIFIDSERYFANCA